MSLINKVAAIIDSKIDLDKVTYLKNKVTYDEEISILDIDFKSIIQSPPMNSSLSTKKELEKISKATKTRSRKEIDLIYLVDNEPLELFYNYLDKKKLIFPKSIFDQHYNILEQYVYALKYYYNRARPEQIAPYFNIDIDIIYTDTHHTPSYPSGHTMYSELAAQILSDQYPSFREDFFRLSDYCGLARILQGVHYPSDNAASKIAVAKLYKLMKERQNEKSKNFPTNIKPKN